MMILFEGNTLTIGDASRKLRNPIQKIEHFENIVVVLLERELNSDFLENVMAFDYSLKLIWQIQKFPVFEFQGKTYVGVTKPYIDMEKLSETELLLFNYDGTRLNVNPLNGQLLVNPMESRIGKRPW